MSTSARFAFFGQESSTRGAPKARLPRDLHRCPPDLDLLPVCCHRKLSVNGRLASSAWHRSSSSGPKILGYDQMRNSNVRPSAWCNGSSTAIEFTKQCFSLLFGRRAVRSPHQPLAFFAPGIAESQDWCIAATAWVRASCSLRVAKKISDAT